VLPGNVEGQRALPPALYGAFTLKIKVLVYSVQPYPIPHYANRFTGYGVLADEPQTRVLIVLTENEGETSLANMRNRSKAVELTVHDTQIVGIEVPMPVLASA